MRTEFKSGSLLGIPIHSYNFSETRKRIHDIIQENKKFRKTSYIATANLDFIANTLRFSFTKWNLPELVHCLQGSEIVTADGMPVVWGLRLLGFPIKERVTGADLFRPILEDSVKNSYRLYFLGGKQEEAEMSLQKIQNDYKDIQIVGTSFPFVKASSESEPIDQEILKDINEKNPDILFLSFGNPKQELWFWRNRHLIHVPLVIGIGGTLNFYSGIIKRSPEWMKRIGLEWLYRLKEEPGRLFKRYAKDAFLFLPMFSILFSYSLLLRLLGKIRSRRIFLLNAREFESLDSIEKELGNWIPENRECKLEILNSDYLDPGEIASLFRIKHFIIERNIHFDLKCKKNLNLLLYFHRFFAG